MGLGDMYQAQIDAQEAALYRRCNEYALTLVKSLAKRFPSVPTWQPLDDLMGKLTQIDNMTAKLPDGYGGERKHDYTSPRCWCGEANNVPFPTSGDGKHG